MSTKKQFKIPESPMFDCTSALSASFRQTQDPAGLFRDIFYIGNRDRRSMLLEFSEAIYYLNKAENFHKEARKYGLLHFHIAQAIAWLEVARQRRAGRRSSPRRPA